MSIEAGHNYTFGAPAGKGWPVFGPDGKIIKPGPVLVEESETPKVVDLMRALEESLAAVKQKHQCGCPESCAVPGPSCMAPRR